MLFCVLPLIRSTRENGCSLYSILPVSRQQQLASFLPYSPYRLSQSFALPWFAPSSSMFKLTASFASARFALITSSNEALNRQFSFAEETHPFLATEHQCQDWTPLPYSCPPIAIANNLALVAQSRPGTLLASPADGTNRLPSAGWRRYAHQHHSGSFALSCTIRSRIRSVARARLRDDSLSLTQRPAPYPANASAVVPRHMPR